MTFGKWHPLTEMEGMRREMDRLWRELIPSGGILTPAPIGFGPEIRATRPPVDVIDRDEEVVIKADMPGVKKEDIDISMQEDTLALRGEIKDDAGAPKDTFIISERSRRPYARTIELPMKIDAGKIRADLKDGVLSIHLPKAKELQPRKIKIDVSEEAKG